jgi:hypothetical protein
MHFDFIDGGNASPPEFAYFTFSTYKSSDKINYTVHYADGHSDTTGSFDPSDYSSNPLKLGLEGETISYVEFTDAKGSGKVSLVSVESALDVTHDLSFNVTATDGDGDTALGHIGIHVDGSSTLSGTTGADVFGVGSHGGVETITDFNTADGDKLDLSALLNSVFSAGANVDNYVHLATSGNDVHVQVDTAGNGNFGTGMSHDVAVLDFATAPSHGDIINAVFAGQEHQLHVA